MHFQCSNSFALRIPSRIDNFTNNPQDSVGFPPALNPFSHKSVHVHTLRLSIPYLMQGLNFLPTILLKVDDLDDDETAGVLCKESLQCVEASISKYRLPISLELTSSRRDPCTPSC